jgi:hypothetical protein
MVGFFRAGMYDKTTVFVHRIFLLFSCKCCTPQIASIVDTKIDLNACDNNPKLLSVGLYM